MPDIIASYKLPPLAGNPRPTCPLVWKESVALMRAWEGMRLAQVESMGLTGAAPFGRAIDPHPTRKGLLDLVAITGQRQRNSE